MRLVDERNPLTARAYVNRVWHYLFGEGLVRTPDDFGHLGERPTHPELVDYLARRFIAEGWSTKRVVRLLVTSAVWHQGSVPSAAAVAADPENRWWHHMPMRRLEAEAIRDAMLKIAGRLDPALFGPPIDPYRTAEDPQKRLFSSCYQLSFNGRTDALTRLVNLGNEAGLMSYSVATCTVVSLAGIARPTGLEPATTGSTVRYSNQLSYGPEKCGV